MISISYDMISYYMILSYDMILENFSRTDREQTTQKKEFKPEATLIPVDVRVSGPIVQRVV